jgi:hypothetical protein
MACFHGVSRAHEQLSEGFIGGAVRLCRADAHGNRNAITPPAEIGGPGQAGESLRVRGKHVSAAFVGHNKKLVVAPAAQLFGGAQTLRKGVPYFTEHGVARSYAMRFAQLLRLVDAYPQDSEGWAAAREIVKLNLQALFDFGLARLQFFSFKVTGIAVRQRIQSLGGMKDNGSADALSESVAQNHTLENYLDCVTEFVVRFDGGTTCLQRGSDRRTFIVLDRIRKQGFERRGDRAGDQLYSTESGDRLSGAIPKDDFAAGAEQGNAVWTGVQGGLKKFGAIGHASLSLVPKRLGTLPEPGQRAHCRSGATSIQSA